MNKPLNSYSLKSSSFDLKDLDENSRKVAVYLSRFDNMDSDMDIIRRGAFKKSIQERGPDSMSNRKIAFLRYHDWHKPIGKFLELSEDEKGLFAVGQLSTSTDGMDALADYQEGVIREHSIGFRYVKDKIRFIDDETMEAGGYYEVSEVQLFEGSAVTFGANEMTMTVDVAKGETKQDAAKRIHDEINQITKSLAAGKGTDERLYSLEMKLKFLNARFLELATSEPFVKDALIVEPPVEPQFDWNKVVTNLKL